MAATASFLVTQTSPIDSQTQKNCIYEVSKHLTENKIDLLKFIKLRWPPRTCFRSHVKTDNANRFADLKKHMHHSFQGIIVNNKKSS